MVELNPNHPVTQAVHTEWHKIVALMMHRLGKRKFVIAPADVETFAEMDGHAVTIRFSDIDGIVLELVDEKEAARLARQEGGLPV